MSSIAIIDNLSLNTDGFQLAFVGDNQESRDRNAGGLTGDRSEEEKLFVVANVS